MCRHPGWYLSMVRIYGTEFYDWLFICVRCKHVCRPMVGEEV